MGCSWIGTKRAEVNDGFGFDPESTKELSKKNIE